MPDALHRAVNLEVQTSKSNDLWNVPAGERLMDFKTFPAEFFEFFACYMRFEYALKKSGFFQTQPNGTPVHPPKASTKKYFDELGAGFFQDAQRMAQYFVEKPPKKLQFSEDQKSVEYPKEERPPLTSTSEIEEALRDLRNNLMHGGKIEYLPSPDDGRNKELLSDGIKIIDLAVSKTSRVHSYYDHNR